MNSMSQKLTEVAMLFLKQGFTAFGGPAAHIAMMHDETVKRRKWLNDQDFLDLIGATNLIPGPNSTEMAIHIEMAAFASADAGSDLEQRSWHQLNMVSPELRFDFEME
jgi:chromate transport protein ChrA